MFHRRNPSPQEVAPSGIGRPSEEEQHKHTEECIHFHEELVSKGSPTESAKTYYEPVMRERTFKERFDRVTIIEEPMSEEEIRLTREIRKVPLQKTLPRGSTKQLMSDFRDLKSTNQ
ncbi:hypothetical protein P9112_008037 [Eukaryota sp. TZLM1-RC]